MSTSVSIHPTTPYFRAGAPAQYAITIVTGDRINVHEVYIRLVIWEGATSLRKDRWTIMDERCVVADRGVIPIGSTTFSASFQLPTTCPPTHDTRPGYVEATATGVVTERRPWRCWDIEQAVVVRRLSDGTVARVPSVHTSPDGALSVNLASRRIARGEPVVGWLYGARATTVTMQLISASRRPVDHPRDHRWNVQRFSMLPGSGDRAIPFVFDMPTDVPPSYESVSHTRDWRLDVTGAGEPIRVPIEIVDAPPSTSAYAPPSVAGDHPEAAFAILAAAGWVPLTSPLGLPGHGTLWPAMRFEEGPCDIVLGIGHQPGQGMRLLARITTPSLGLGLHVTPSSRLRELLFDDIQANVPAWDKRHHVSARDAAGAAVHLAALVPSLATLPPLVAWDDRELVFARPIDWVTPDELRELAGELIRVARAHGPKAPAAGPYR